MVKKAKKENKILDFFVDVKKEIKKVRWTSKKNLIKYSITTLGFMVFLCLFFFCEDLIISLISYIKELLG